jgi:hypothetical protein
MPNERVEGLAASGDASAFGQPDVERSIVLDEKSGLNKEVRYQAWCGLLLWMRSTYSSFAQEVFTASLKGNTEGRGNEPLKGRIVKTTTAPAKPVANDL